MMLTFSGARGLGLTIEISESAILRGLRLLGCALNRESLELALRFHVLNIRVLAFFAIYIIGFS